MTPLELQFFQLLDSELNKVQAFYREREKEALVRCALIREQLNGLEDHRKIFHVCTRISKHFSSRPDPLDK